MNTRYFISVESVGDHLINGTTLSKPSINQLRAWARATFFEGHLTLRKNFSAGHFARYDIFIDGKRTDHQVCWIECDNDPDAAIDWGKQALLPDHELTHWMKRFESFGGRL